MKLLPKLWTLDQELGSITWQILLKDDNSTSSSELTWAVNTAKGEGLLTVLSPVQALSSVGKEPFPTLYVDSQKEGEVRPTQLDKLYLSYLILSILSYLYIYTTVR